MARPPRNLGTPPCDPIDQLLFVMLHQTMARMPTVMGITMHPSPQTPPTAEGHLALCALAVMVFHDSFRKYTKYSPLHHAVTTEFAPNKRARVDVDTTINSSAASLNPAIGSDAFSTSHRAAVPAIRDECAKKAMHIARLAMN